MPSPAASSSKPPKPTSARRARSVSGRRPEGRPRARASATTTSVPPGGGDPRELLEERDHVQEHDEVEGAVREGERGGVGDLEAHAAGELGRKQPPRLVDHRRERDRRRRPRPPESARRRAAPPAPSPCRRRARARRSTLSRSRAAASGAAQAGPRPRVPAGREPVELDAQAAAEEAPETRASRRRPARAKRANRRPSRLQQARRFTRSAREAELLPRRAPRTSRPRCPG